MVFSILGVSGNSETRHLTNLLNFSYKWTSLALLHADVVEGFLKNGPGF